MLSVEAAGLRNGVAVDTDVGVPARAVVRPRPANADRALGAASVDATAGRVCVAVDTDVGVLVLIPPIVITRIAAS
jgi:hypothetical protein